MNRKQKENLRSALRKLSGWFSRNSRVLPWRSNPTVYRVWISEIMLQQTQVAAVIPFFGRFIARFPSVKILARAKESEVLRYWAGLGYYSRARNLHAAAKRIVRHGGFPKDRESWLGLPGVGEYTAGAVLSIAMNLPEPVLDANVKRVIARAKKAGPDFDRNNKRKYWETSKAWVKESHAIGLEPRAVNQALMELGALVCKPGKPLCDRCPLSDICLSFGTGDPSYLPGKKKKKWVRLEETVYALVAPDGKALFSRNNGRWRKGLWDFPACIPDQIVGSPFRTVKTLRVRYTVTHHVVDRTCRILRVSAVKKSRSNDDFRFVDMKRPGLAMGSPAKKLLELVRSELDGD